MPDLMLAWIIIPLTVAAFALAYWFLTSCRFRWNANSKMCFVKGVKKMAKFEVGQEIAAKEVEEQTEIFGGARV